MKVIVHIFNSITQIRNWMYEYYNNQKKGFPHDDIVLYITDNRIMHGDTMHYCVVKDLVREKIQGMNFDDFLLHDCAVDMPTLDTLQYRKARTLAHKRPIYRRSN